MPQMGVSVAEGTVSAWLKSAGDEIAADETICEVTTDKIDVEIPAPAAGVLAEILVEEGETVAVGTVLAGIEPAGSGRTGAEREERRISVTRRSRGPGCAATDGELDRSGFHSPVVRRIAGEHGIDLTRSRAHGVGGGSARRTCSR